MGENKDLSKASDILKDGFERAGAHLQRSQSWWQKDTAWQELLPRLSPYAHEEAEVAGPADPVNQTNVLIKPQFWT